MNDMQAPEAPSQRTTNRVAKPMTVSQSRDLQRKFQSKLAGRWVGGCHLMEVARSVGLDVAETERLVAWGLLARGDVGLDDMIRHGFYKPKDNGQKEK